MTTPGADFPLYTPENPPPATPVLLSVILSERDRAYARERESKGPYFTDDVSCHP